MGQKKYNSSSWGNLFRRRNNRRWQGASKEKYSRVIDKYRLVFTDPELEAQYDLEHRNRYLKSQRIGLFIIVILLLIVAVNGGLETSFTTNRLIHVDFGMCAVVLLGLILICVPRFVPYVPHILSTCFLGLVVILMWIEQVGYQKAGPWVDLSSSWAVLVLCVVFTILRVKFWMAALTGGLAWITNVIIVFAFWAPKGIPWYKLLTSTFLMAIVIGVTGYAGYRIETQLRIEMLHRKILEIEGKKAKRTQVRDDKILRNIFPAGLVEKLKERQTTGQHTPNSSDTSMGDSYDCVSVILCDIVGFTDMSSKISPKQLVELLNTTFSMFDSVCEDLKLEKIRTIGDAYLCVGNMSVAVKNHQEVAVEAGFRMLQSIWQLSERTGVPLNLRVGIACGPVIAGVTGTNKWNYDIFGNTFSNAALLERVGSPGGILVSQTIVDALKSSQVYNFTPKSPSPRDENESEVACYKVVQANLSNDPFAANLPKSLSASDVIHIGGNKKQEHSHLNLLAVDWSPNMEADEDEALSAIVSSKYYQSLAKETYGTPKQSAKSRFKIVDLWSKQDESYSNAALKQEMIGFQKRKYLRMKFTDPKRESDFWQTLAFNMTKYCRRFTVFLIVLVFVYVIQDLVIAPTPINHVSTVVWVFYAIILVLLSGLYGFANTKWFLLPIAEWISVVTLTTCMAMAVLIALLDDGSVYHFHRGPILVFASFLYIRVRLPLMCIFSIPVVIVGVFLAFTRMNQYGDKLTLAGIYVVAIIVAFNGNYFLARSLRMGFLQVRMIKNDLLQQQSDKERTKLLLHNILPEQILHRLKPGVQQVVDQFDNATIMFVSMTNFHTLSNTHAAKVLSLLNDVFTAFDELTVKSGMEKIKTINSTYMCASGIPVPRKDHCEAAVVLALRMQQAFSSMQERSSTLSLINLRIGIACGPVVAGIIGRTKYSYDCWSDTVNTASRMDSSGLESHIQFTQEVYDVVKINFESSITQRGGIEVKGKGTMTTYLLNMPRHIQSTAMLPVVPSFHTYSPAISAAPSKIQKSNSVSITVSDDFVEDL